MSLPFKMITLVIVINGEVDGKTKGAAVSDTFCYLKLTRKGCVGQGSDSESSLDDAHLSSSKYCT